MLYTTISPNRHWYFNTAFSFLFKNHEIKFSSIFKILKLLFYNNEIVILLDCGLYAKLFLLLFSNKNLYIVLHGELGYVNSVDLKYRLYYKILCFCLKFSVCNKVLLSRYVSLPMRISNKFVLEHPGFSKDYEKIHFVGDLVSFGALSNSKISNVSLVNVNNLLTRYNIKVDHFGSSFINKKFNKIVFNGFISDDFLNRLFSESKFILLLNDSLYYNIVSGIVIQAIYNECFIITLDRYPEIIDFYEKSYNVKFHIDLNSFLLISDKNEFYNLHKACLSSLKKILINNTRTDILKLIR